MNGTRLKLLLGLLILFEGFVLGCNERSSNNLNHLIYEQDDKKIELRLEPKSSHLKMGETTKIQFVPTNIDPLTIGVFGCGFQNISTATKRSWFQITPTSECIKNDKVEVTVTEMIHSDKAFKKTFYIPVEP